jgi:hypothetical protein
MHKDAVLECMNTFGPGSGDPRGPLIDYLGNAVLVWLAFAFLPFSKKFEVASVVREKQFDEESFSCKCCCFTGKWNNGRMFKLLWHDLQSFFLSAAILAVLSYFTCKTDFEDGNGQWWLDPQFRQNLFWVRVFYAFCSAPFLPYSVPALLILLTHSTATGYNEHGAVVRYSYAVDANDEHLTGTITDQAAQKTIDAGVQEVKTATKKATHVRFSLWGSSREEDIRSEQNLVPNASDEADTPLLTAEADSSRVPDETTAGASSSSSSPAPNTGPNRRSTGAGETSQQGETAPAEERRYLRNFFRGARAKKVSINPSASLQPDDANSSGV